MFALDDEIKVLYHAGYGLFGYSIPKFVYDYLELRYPHKKDILNIDRHGIYLRDTSDKSRFDPVLIEAFEEFLKTEDGNNCDYEVKTLKFELQYDSFDGMESDIRLIGS